MLKFLWACLSRRLPAGAAGLFFLCLCQRLFASSLGILAYGQELTGNAYVLLRL